MKFLLSSTYLGDKIDSNSGNVNYIELLKKVNIPYEKTITEFGERFYITINTLDELMKIVDVMPAEIIITKDYLSDGIHEIEIYDDYREQSNFSYI